MIHAKKTGAAYNGYNGSESISKKGNLIAERGAPGKSQGRQVVDVEVEGLARGQRLLVLERGDFELPVGASEGKKIIGDLGEKSGVLDLGSQEGRVRKVNSYQLLRGDLLLL